MSTGRRAGVLSGLVAGALSFSACGRPAPPGGGGASETGALEVVARYDEAWTRKDVPEIEKLLAPEYVYFSSRGETSDRAATKAMLASPGYRLDRGRRDELRTYRSGSTVVVSSHWTGAGTFDGKSFTDDQRCSVVVAFADGRGRVLSEHCTNIPPPDGLLPANSP